MNKTHDKINCQTIRISKILYYCTVLSLWLNIFIGKICILKLKIEMVLS